jgi:hypothetical protein|tara:strand:+ start:319 stop:792 length:474 start_codon:yes stop_codon:yes gene_type:complete
MADTRLKVATSATVYHRHAAANDAPLSDVATNEALASGLGSNADFLFDADDNQTWTDESSVAAASGETQMEALGSPLFLWIKHSGYQDAAKATASTSTTKVMIGVAGAAANGFISLFPGQSIILTAPFGSNIDNLDDFDMITSASEAVYVEVKAMVD